MIEAPSAPSSPSIDVAPSPAAPSGNVSREVHFSSGNSNGQPDKGAKDSELFKGLDDLADSEPEPVKEAPTTKQKAEIPKPEKEPDTKEAKEETAAVEEEDEDDDFLNPAATKKGVDKPKSDKTETEAVTEEPKVSGIKELRSQYDKTKSELATVAKTIESKEKEIAELRTKLSAKDYTESQEYIDRYEKPLRDAVNYAAKEVQGIEVMDANGNSVMADYGRDFAPLLNASLPTNQVVRLAQEKFGDMANEVLDLRREIMKAHSKKLEAAKDFRERSDQIRQEQAENSIKQRESVKAKFSELRDEMKADARYKSLFNPGDDSKQQRLLDDGETLVKRAFEPTPGTPINDILRDQAAAANRIVAAGILARKVKQMEQEIATLKKYRQTNPGRGDGLGSVQGDNNGDPIEAMTQWADR